jgi:NAD(P)-dependent dehydrogenase (short-subunit alcohol dehydrogenase family)
MTQSTRRPVAIVTGAGRGVGRAHALELARAGWAVLVNDLGGEGNGTGADLTPAQQVAEEIRSLGGEAIVDGSDVSDWTAAGDMVQRAVDAFGRLDGLVNNAGVLRDRTIANLSEEDWDVAVRVNLKGTAAPLHHAARYWRDLTKATGEPVQASVVNTTSGSGLYYNIGQANYSSAKAGVAALTVIAARELGRYGVRVNCIAPVAATRLTASVMSEEGKERFDPALISPLVVYLLSEAAKEVTARIFNVGGDAFVAFDTPRPLAGLRAPGGRWTAEAIAQVMPTLLAGVEEPLTAQQATRFMMSTPLADEMA